MAYRGESRLAGAAPAKSEQFCISQAGKSVRGQGVWGLGEEAGQMQLEYGTVQMLYVPEGT